MKFIQHTLMVMLFALMLPAIVFAGADTVTLVSPGNNTVAATSAVSYTFNYVGNTSTESCVLYTDHTGSWAARETNSGVANNTNTTFNALEHDDAVAGSYLWNVACDGVFAAANYTYGVDTVDPVVTINSPSSAATYWDNDGQFVFNLTVVDNNPNECVLYSTLNATSNTSGTYGSKETDSYTNNTAFAFDFGNASTFADNNNGAYVWNYICDDDAGNSVTLAVNRTLYVDTVAPTTFACLATDGGPADDSTSNDLTPQVTWNATTDTNFNRYEVFMNDSAGSSYNFNETTRTTTSRAVSVATSADRTYNWWIRAIDDAGNVANATACTEASPWTFTTDISYWSLTAGWNVLVNGGNAKNLSTFVDEIDGATTASYYNSSHQFQSYVDGSSTNAGVDVGPGEGVLVYVTSATNWEGNVWNTSAIVSNWTITNNTNSDWNLVSNTDSNTSRSVTFANIDYHINGNGTAVTQINATYYSYYDDSAAVGAKYVPGRSNWTFNNAETVPYLGAFWVSSDVSTETINWSAIQ